MEDITIRPARAEDEAAVVAIARAAWTPIYEEFRRRLGDELFSLFYPTPLDDKEAQVKATLLNGGCFVSELEGRVVGFINVSLDEAKRVGRIGNNAVDPTIRGRGIGGRQYDFVKQHLRERGALAVAVMTGLDDAHAPARRAYEKAGFELNLPSVNYFQKL